MAKNSKNKARPRLPVPLGEIERELDVQLKFLRSSCVNFDNGDIDEFRRIALSTRIIVHNAGQSKSLLNQLGLNHIRFRVDSRAIDPRNLLSETPLVMMQMDQHGTAYKPILDQGTETPRILDFTSWWTEEAFRSPQGVSMSRSGFIMHTANQAGGAHVDSELDEEFARIAHFNEAGWVSRVGDIETPIQHLEKAYVRQIGFELIESLGPVWEKIEGHAACRCGSGKKQKYCRCEIST